LLKCEHCGYEWEYKGRLARASCPSCGQKVSAETQHRRPFRLGAGYPVASAKQPDTYKATLQHMSQEIEEITQRLEELRDVLNQLLQAGEKQA
jgi:uncharacterized Zn finger protein (UPF0148 family)